MHTLLSIAIAMIAGLLLTRVAKLVKLPNVTGYLVAGLLISSALTVERRDRSGRGPAAGAPGRAA